MHLALWSNISNLVGIDSPVCEKFWKHSSKKTKKSTRSTHRDIVLNEQRRQYTPSKSWNQVNNSDSHCTCDKRKKSAYSEDTTATKNKSLKEV